MDTVFQPCYGPGAWRDHGWPDSATRPKCACNRGPGSRRCLHGDRRSRRLYQSRDPADISASLLGRSVGLAFVRAEDLPVAMRHEAVRASTTRPGRGTLRASPFFVLVKVASTLVEINIGPIEPQGFACPCARSKQEDDERAQVSRAGPDQKLRLIGLQPPRRYPWAALVGQVWALHTSPCGQHGGARQRRG